MSGITKLTGITTTSGVTQPLVVGVDGSPASDAAVRYAAGEAASRNLPLAVVHTWQPFPAWAVSMWAPVPMTLTPDVLEQAGRTILGRAAAIVESAAPEVSHEEYLVQGSAETVLTAAAEHALLLIVGGGSQSDHGPGWLGSVALHLVSAARCPVAVTPSGPPRLGDVVVGVDGSATAQDALAFAFEEASRTRTSVWAVYAFSPKEAPVGLDESSFADLRQNARRQLSELLAGWADKYPDVTLNEIVTSDHPSRALRAAAEDAALLVVGSRGHGALLRHALGSVSSDLLRTAPCPVVVCGTHHHVAEVSDR